MKTLLFIILILGLFSCSKTHVQKPINQDYYYYIQSVDTHDSTNRSAVAVTYSTPQQQQAMQYTVFDDNTCDCKEHPQDERCKSLPVTFMSIIAIKMPGYNIITWDVAMEVNIQYYSVMRSSNGKIYNEIAKVSAKGLSEYKYIDYFK